ncbi:MAG: hypothetical protein Q4D39_03630 [Coriobacteriaceae bacterium]|nr:hypothetical protein [Coriobacteriaceae bacterium]
MVKRSAMSLGTALAVAACLIFAPSFALADPATPAEQDAEATEQTAEKAEPAPLTVKTQPEDVEVHYPEGASFHVEVSDPERVASYQWIASDGYTDFVLDGVTATTDTLVIPATEQDNNDLYYRCAITDIDGNLIESEPGVLRNPDRYEDRTVLYVGDHAVVPGQRLDLASTTLGSGTVIFESDGTTITLDNVHLSTATMTYDTQLSPSLGLFLMRRNGTELEYHVNLVGENVFEDTYFDPEYNAGGIVFNSYFAAGDDPNPPTIFIEGDGTLTLKGGSNSIYSDANIEIDAALSTESDGEHYCDAITGRTIFIGSGAKLNLNANGTGLRVKGDLHIEQGATVEIVSVPPRVSVGYTAKSIINADGSVYITGSTVSLKGVADPERFVPYGSGLANFVGITYLGNLSVDSSTVTIEMTQGEADEDWFISCYGISGDGETSAVSMTGASKVFVTVETPGAPFVGGITISGLLSMEKDCRLEVTAVSAGETLGIEADRAITMDDANLVCKVSSASDEVLTFGVVCGGFEFSCSKDGYVLHSTAAKGIALAVDTGEHGEFTVKPAAGYTPKVVDIEPPAVIMIPATGEVNVVGVPGYGETIKAETIYNPNDRSAPAAEVEIGMHHPGGNVVVAGVAFLAVVAGAAYVYHRKWRTKVKPLGEV